MMRNLLFTLLLLVSGQALMGQSQEITGMRLESTPVLNSSSQKTAMVADTLDEYFQRATALYTLTASNGYVLGTNPGLLETAVHYDNPGGVATITEVIALFTVKAVMGGSADSISIFAYAAGPDSMPMGLPIATGKFSTDDADTSGSATFIPMTTTTPATGGFLISLVHATTATDDTIAVLSSNVLPQGGGPDGNGEKRVRQNTAGGWLRASDIWTIANSPFDADAMLIPIVDVTAVGVDPQANGSSFQLFRAYPNPAVNELRIPYAIDATQPVSLMLIDATGRIIHRADAGDMGAGAHEWQLDTSELAAGTYYYVLSAGTQRLGGKFMHAK